MIHEETSARVAKLAARGMRDPNSLSLEEIKSVCASALTQRAIEDEFAVVPANEQSEFTELGEAGEPAPGTITVNGGTVDLAELTKAFQEKLKFVVIPSSRTALRLAMWMIEYLNEKARA